MHWWVGGLGCGPGQEGCGSKYVKLFILFLVIGTSDPILALAVSMISSTVSILILPHSGVKRSGITSAVKMMSIYIFSFMITSSALSVVNLRRRTVIGPIISDQSRLLPLGEFQLDLMQPYARIFFVAMLNLLLPKLLSRVLMTGVVEVLFS